MATISGVAAISGYTIYNSFAVVYTNSRNDGVTSVLNPHPTEAPFEGGLGVDLTIFLSIISINHSEIVLQRPLTAAYIIISFTVIARDILLSLVIESYSKLLLAIPFYYKGYKGPQGPIIPVNNVTIRPTSWALYYCYNQGLQGPVGL